MTTLTTTMAVKVSTATPRGKVTAVIGFPCFSETESLSWSCGQQELIVGAKDQVAVLIQHWIFKFAL